MNGGMAIIIRCIKCIICISIMCGRIMIKYGGSEAIYRIGVNICI